MPYAGLHALTEFDTFTFIYESVVEDLARNASLQWQTDPDALYACYQDWVFRYFELVINGRRSDRATFLTGIYLLIEVAARHELVAYDDGEADHDGAVSLVGKVLIRYSDAFTALAFGAVIYSNEVERRTRTDPSCPLKPIEIASAARTLSENPRAARSFRRLLRLKRMGRQQS